MSNPPKANRKPTPAAIRAATRRAPAAPTPVSEEPPSSENRAQLHKDRAKRWGAPSPWAAEWFENAVRYCQTPEGRQRYETWLKSRTPPGEVTSILKAIAEPPFKQSGPGRGNLKMWNNAAYELGVSDEALKQFHSFTATDNLVAPERTLPPVRRRRGESAAEYLTRRHDSLLQGCKIPDIDWKDIRKIAIAQYDATRDTYEMWHKDMEFYIDVLRTRASTTVAIDRAINKALSGPTPELDMEIQLRTDAYRSTQLLIHIGHVFWRRASEVLDELDRKGLVTSSAIERAYLKDSRLKWRLVSVRELGVLYRAKCGARLETVFARLPAFRNYIKSYRTADGQLHLELNHAYIRNHPWKGDSVDELVTYMCAKSTGSFYMYFRELNNLLHKYPKEAEKFTSNAWDEIGIMSDICEFTTAFVESPFAQNLLNHASKELTSEEEKLMMEELCFMNPGMLKEDTTKYNVSYQQRSGRAERITLDMISTWSNEIYDAKMTPGNFMGITTVRDQSGSKHELFRGMTEEQMRVLIIPMFDEMWLMTDGMLWEKAKRLDPPGKKGFVAKMFGLYDPSKPRTFYIEIFMEEIKAARKTKESQGDKAKENAAGVAKTEYHSPFPVAGPLDSAGRSGHAYVTALGGDSKEKVKTRGEANNSDATANVEEEEEEEELPDVLPTEFKLPKKVWKLFNRLLEDDTKTDTDASQKKGQVRWGEFEKGMKRIGFDVVQTAGSSVRFDPPARNGRPITFHRPHPDSLLTPHLIKWVGARLKRTYGWTTETFQRKEGDGTTEHD